MVRTKGNNKDLLGELVKTDFKLRYNNSVLGFLWVFLKPFLLFLILLVVFSKLAGSKIHDYPVYLLLGIIMFTFFSEGTTYGMNSLLNKSGIILKINFPRHIAVISATVLSTINFGLNMIIFVVISFLFHISYSVGAILYFLLIAVCLYLLIINFSLFFSIFYVRLRDLSNIWELALQLVFYGTPIVYSITQLPSKVQTLVSLNPLTFLIQAARDCIIYGTISYSIKIPILFTIEIIVLYFAQKYFNYAVKKIAEYF